MIHNSQHTVYRILFVLILFSLLFSASGLMAQQEIIISGKIRDSKSLEPLPYASIEIQGTTKGTVSDAQGNYTVNLDEVPVFLRFSHIGYQPRIIRISEKDHQVLDVDLRMQAELLKEVQILSDRTETVYKDSQYSVIDYDLSGDHIYLLVCKNRLARSRLVLLNLDMDTLIVSGFLRGKPSCLVRDCLDNVHLITQDSAFQVFHEEGVFKLLYGLEHEKFIEAFASCETILDEKVYFSEYEFFNLVVEYFHVDTNTKELKVMRRIADDEKVNMLRRNRDNLKIPEDDKRMLELSSEFQSRESLKKMRDIENEVRFLKMAFYQPVFAPLIRMGNKICLFNMPEAKLEVYDSRDSLLVKAPLSFIEEHKKNEKRLFREGLKWEKEIFADEVLGKIFTLFSQNASREIWEIDLNTGEYQFVFRIPYAFPEKIKVHNNHIYFIYKGVLDMEKKTLFRSKIVEK